MTFRKIWTAPELRTGVRTAPRLPLNHRSITRRTMRRIFELGRTNDTQLRPSSCETHGENAQLEGPLSQAIATARAATSLRRRKE